MTNKKLLVYLSTVLASLIPCPGRFAFGILLVIVFNIVFILSSLLDYFFKKLSIAEYSKFFMPLLICSLVTIAYRLIVFFSPIIALQLSFILYIQAFSIYLLFFKFDEGNVLSVKDVIRTQFFNCACYTVLTLAFTLIRDIFGYGCISFPTPDGVYSLRLFNVSYFTFMNFFASIPGAAVICAVVISVLLHYNSLKNSQTEVENE